MNRWLIHTLILWLLIPLFSSIAGASLVCSKVHENNPLQKQALQELQSFIQTMPMVGERPPHELEIINGRGVLRVGLLINTEKRFSALLLRALKVGAISEIDGGTVVGPKVLLLLSQIKSLSPTPVVVKGTLISDFVFPALESDIKGTKQWEAGLGPRPDFPWSESEIRSLPIALDTLKLKEACLKLWGASDLKNCGRMKFQFRTPDVESIQWSLPGQ